MKISVIIPVYKVEKYIERCLLSVMAQTYDHAEIECILVDDCTPDHSMDMAKDIVRREKTDVVFVYLKHQVNAGVSVSRNTGMTEARGEYIFFLDSDDFIMPNCLELLMGQTALHPGVEMVLGNFYHDKPGGGLKMKSDMIPPFLQDHHQIFSFYLCDILPMMPWNVLISRSFIVNNHLQFAKGLLQEDILWSFHLYRCTSQMAFVPEVTYQYCDNESSIMNRADNRTAFANSYCYILSEICNYIDSSHYVDFMIFALRLLFRGRDYASQPDVDSQYLIRLNEIRNQLFYRTLKDGRIVLSAAFSLLFKPFSYVKHWSIFRRYYDHWIYVVKILAETFNIFHK